MPLVRRTRATLRSAEFGFLGVVVYTRVHTPRFCGHSRMAGDFVFHRLRSRPSRMSWLIVGIVVLVAESERPAGGHGGAQSMDRRPAVKRFHPLRRLPYAFFRNAETSEKRASRNVRT